MAKKTVQVVVSKEAHELGEGLSKLVKVIRTQLANGWQVGEDLGPIFQSAIGDLVPAVQGVDQLTAEQREDPVAFAHAVSLGLADIYAAAQG